MWSVDAAVTDRNGLTRLLMVIDDYLIDNKCILAAEKEFRRKHSPSATHDGRVGTVDHYEKRLRYKCSKQVEEVYTVLK